ncbi:MFS transporter [Hymenobacter roseosalivarius]|uniref:MFS transporter n=1 Tax=Hymenobacter roseosalivarius TaxID=89967 RepID=UPI00293718A2|nr:MFS transporter [Hymenobacter roseosalivarius]
MQKQRTRMAVAAVFFLSGMCFASWASRIPDISLKLGLSEGQLGQLLLAMPLAGWLVHSWGSRQVVLLSAGMYAVFLPLLGWAEHFWTLAPALALFGFAGNLLNIAVNTQAIGVQAHYGQTIMASFHGLWSLAGFLGGALGALLIGWQQTPLTHFLLIMGVGLLLILLAHRHTPRQDEGSLPCAAPIRTCCALELLPSAECSVKAACSIGAACTFSCGAPRCRAGDQWLRGLHEHHGAGALHLRLLYPSLGPGPDAANQ